MPKPAQQASSLLNRVLLPRPHKKPELLADYYTWFTSSASFGLFTILVAALLAQNTHTPETLFAKLGSSQQELVSKVARPLKSQLPPPALSEEVKLLAGVTPLPKPALPSRPERETLSLALSRGSNIMNLLTEQGISHDQAFNAVEAMRKVYNPRRLQAGQEISLKLRHKEDSSSLEKLSMRVTPLETVTIQKSAGKFLAEKAEIETSRKLVRAGGPIAGSFYQTGINTGISPQMISELITAFSYDVDFQRDIQPGQRMDVLYDHFVDEKGKPVKQGELKYAALEMKNGKKLEIYRYRDQYGNIGFFHPNGESIRKALLKTPVNGARISSGFGMRRHPILGYSKMHRGMDFAAPTGTPVYAAGDGIVQRASIYGAYGNYLNIKHNGTYSTAYGHLSRFAPGIRPGSRVRQGQIVAYIGTTGRSTGPHLHYEILKYGAQVNPNAAKFTAGNFLEGKELALFRQHVNKVQTQFAGLRRNKTELASAQ